MHNVKTVCSPLEAILYDMRRQDTKNLMASFMGHFVTLYAQMSVECAYPTKRRNDLCKPRFHTLSIFHTFLHNCIVTLEN